jgi:predicted transcriptional regulator YdeE
LGDADGASLRMSRCQAVGRTLDEVERVWFPQAKHRDARVADVELYNDPFCGGDDAEMEYWVSVVPKSH